MRIWHVRRTETPSGIAAQICISVIVPVKAVPEKDQPILGGAVAAHCTHLVTGDLQDFGALMGKDYHGVLVVTPRMLAELMADCGFATAPRRKPSSPASSAPYAAKTNTPPTSSTHS